MEIVQLKPILIHKRLFQEVESSFGVQNPISMNKTNLC